VAFGAYVVKSQLCSSSRDCRDHFSNFAFEIAGLASSPSGAGVVSYEHVEVLNNDMPILKIVTFRATEL
jgi:hypothetical protein